MVREVLAIYEKNYKDPRYVNLDNTGKDAESICRFFKKELPKGYRFDRAKPMKDPTAAEVTAYLEEVLKRLDDDSVFVFYFSGHGLYNGETDRQVLLCNDALGVLADGFDGTGALTLDFMRSFSQRAKGKVIFIYDCCRTVVERGHKGEGNFGRVDKFKTATAERPDRARYGGSGLRWSIMSCGMGERARDDGSFVKALLSVMRESIKSGRELLLDNESFVRRVYYSLGMGTQRPEASGDSIVLAPAGVATERRDFGFAAICAVVATLAILFGLSQRSTDPGVKELIAEQSREIAKKESALTELTRKNEELSKELAALKEATDSSGGVEVAELIRRNDDLAKQLVELRSQSDSTTEDLASKDAALAALSKRFDELQKSADSMKSELSSKDARIRELTSQNETYEKRISDASTKLTATETDLADARREYGELKKNADATSTKLKTTEKDLADARSKIKSLEEKVQTSNQGSTAVDESVADAVADVSDAVANPTEFTNALGQRFVLIKSGKFKMGSPVTEKDRDSDETQHEVTLTKDFYFCVYPVTRGDFAKFVDATGYKTTAEVEGSAYGYDKNGECGNNKGLNWRNPGFSQTDDHPVVCVSWYDAQKYVEWLNDQYGDKLPAGFKYSLPTEAECEFAIRGGKTTRFFWGDDEKDGEGYLNAADESGSPQGNKWNAYFPFNDGYKATSPVGTFKPNPFGLYDMEGNASMWCLDWYGAYPAGAVTDPTGPIGGSNRVIRGGSWLGDPGGCRSARRGRNAPESRNSGVGFRLALKSA